MEYNLMMPTNDPISANPPSWENSILIVSDDADTRDPLRARLQVAGNDVHLVDNEDDALAYVLNAAPALIILDDSIPVMDVYGFVQKIRGFDEARFTPTLLISSTGDTVDRVRAYQAGIDAFMTKPVILVEVAARVQGLLKSRLLYRNLLDENRELQGAYDAHRETEQLYRSLFSALPLPTVVVDPANVVVALANDKASELTGYDPESLTGLALSQLSPGEQGSDWLPRMCAEVIQDGLVRSEEGSIVGADGRRIPVGAEMATTQSGGHRYAVLTMSDLRVRNEADVERMTNQRSSMLRETAIAVSSRINDPLFVILNDVAALQAALTTADHPIQSRLARVYEAAQRIQRVTAQLSAISTVVTKEYLPGVRMLDLDESVGASVERSNGESS